jgi:hypothetical protein
MQSCLRIVAAMIVGLLAALFVIFIMDFLYSLLFPSVPGGIDTSGPDAMRTIVPTMVGDAIFVIVRWGVAGLVAVWITTRILNSDD